MKKTEIKKSDNSPKIIKESLIDDKSIAGAIDEGMLSDSIDTNEFMKKLRSRIQ